MVGEIKVNLLDILLTILSLSSCLRLLFYRRGPSKFKVGYSFVAYLFIVSSGALGIAILTGILHSMQLPKALIALFILVAIAIFYCNGNVARILNLPRRIQHHRNLR